MNLSLPNFLGHHVLRASYFIFSIGIAGILSSCSTTLYPATPEVVKNTKPEEGLIVATFSTKSFTTSGELLKRSPVAHVFIENEQTGEKVALVPQISSKNKSSSMLQIGARPSEAVAIPVPAGRYKITGWYVSDILGAGTITFRNREPMSVPFDVRAGSSTYIGRANILTRYGKNILRQHVLGGGLIIFTDEFAADASTITSTYPSIKRSSILRSDVPAAYKRDMKRIAETSPPKIFGLF